MHGNHDPATYTGYTGSDTQPHFHGGGGDITYVHLFLVSSIIVASVRPEVRLRPNEAVWIKFDQDRCHLFDGG